MAYDLSLQLAWYHVTEDLNGGRRRGVFIRVGRHASRQTAMFCYLPLVYQTQTDEDKKDGNMIRQDKSRQTVEGTAVADGERFYSHTVIIHHTSLR